MRYLAPKKRDSDWWHLLAGELPNRQLHEARWTVSSCSLCTFPRGQCKSMVYALTLKRALHHDFRVYVCTLEFGPGPVGIGNVVSDKGRGS